SNESDINLFLKFLDDKNSLIVEKAAISLYRLLKRLSSLPQNLDPTVIKKLYNIFLSLQKKEYAEGIKKDFKDYL
ncbi:MAG: hypothetical protein ABDH37_01915, partial [Candidatus Hydrothermales bacterium]